MSPLLFRAGNWPEDSELTRPKDAREQAEDPRSIVVDPSASQLLESSVRLLHSALRNQDLDERLFWNHKKDLFYQLRYQPPETPPEDGDPYALWEAWSGWASWSLIKGSLNAFAFGLKYAKRRDVADADGYFDILGEVLTNDFRDDLLADKTKTEFLPCSGSGIWAAIRTLDGGYGTMYPYFYSFTDGQVFVGCLQTIAHSDGSDTPFSPD